ncbi:hypothetical protein JCM11641_007768 [Rhodosporidiobolus odoratus]
MQAVELRELKFNPRLRAKLLQAQYLTASEVLLTPPAALSRRAKLSPTEISQVLHDLSVAVCSRDAARDRSISEVVQNNSEQGKGYAMTTGDAGLDDLLGGGLRTGSLTEVAGHSSSGKTHICLQASLTVQLPLELGGLSGGALFISSEGTVPSTRLFSLASSLAASLAPPSPESSSSSSSPPYTAWDFLDNVHTEKAPDVETLDAVLSYHAPAAIERIDALASANSPSPSTISPFDDPLPSQYLSLNRPCPPRPPLPIRLIMIDSIAAPFRAETETGSTGFAQRAKEFAHLGDTMKRLAHVYGCAVIVVNQVTDVFDSRGAMPQSFLQDVPANPTAPPFPPSSFAPSPFPRRPLVSSTTSASASRTKSTSSSSTSSTTNSAGLPPPPHQQYRFPSLLYSRFQSPHFSGASSSLSSSSFSILPFHSTSAVSAALGHSWSNIPNVRMLCLLKRGEGERRRSRRAATVVFSPYAPRGAIGYEILEDHGVRSVGEVVVRGLGNASSAEEGEGEGEREAGEAARKNGEGGVDEEERLWRELDGHAAVQECGR